MLTLTASFFVVYYSPVELDGEYPTWVLFYTMFAVQGYQVSYNIFLNLFESIWTMQMENKLEKRGIPHAWECCSITAVTW